jgi:hypothetical protein
LTTPNDLAYPAYNGDDTAIIFTLADPGTDTGYSLASQSVGPDGVTPTGSPTLWVPNAGLAAVYRRGTFVASNAPPTVTWVQPDPSTTYTPPASIVLQAAATDANGVAKVEFFNGAIRLGEATAAPYRYTWSNVPAGPYRLVARATDVLGAQGDSPALAITVGSPATRPQITLARLPATGEIEMTFLTETGRTYQVQKSSDLSANPVQWTSAPEITDVDPAAPFRAKIPTGSARQFYRVLVLP